MIAKTDLMFERVLRLKFAHEEYTKGMTNEFEEALKELYKKFLEKHQEIEALKFSLYVPNFNDGAVCTLTFSGVEVLLKEEVNNLNILKEEYEKANDDSFNDENFWNDSFSLERYLTDYSPLITDLKELDNLLERVEPILESIYGINVRIVVDCSKIEVEEYDCGY